jgi:hypothetical protein
LYVAATINSISPHKGRRRARKYVAAKWQWKRSGGASLARARLARGQSYGLALINHEQQDLGELAKDSKEKD